MEQDLSSLFSGLVIMMGFGVIGFAIMKMVIAITLLSYVGKIRNELRSIARSLANLELGPDKERIHRMVEGWEP